MSPRFERRADKPARAYGRDRRVERGSQAARGRQARPRPDWGERSGERDAGRRPLRGSQRTPEPGAERGRERSGERVWASARRSSPARPESRRVDRPRRDGGRFEGSRFEGSRPERGRPERSRQPLLRRDLAPAPPAATAEAERLGQPDPGEDMVWGRHAALAVLESGRPVHRIWCTTELRFSPKFLQQLREAKASGVLVEEVTWARLGQLTAGAVHQGIVLQTAAADTLDLDSLIEGCGGIGEPPLLMALDGITDPHNLGAIARSAEALGAHGLVLPQRRSAGLTGSVAKVAAGALEHLPVARVVNLNRALERLKQEGYRVIGLASEGSVSLEQADLEGPLVIVTGSEADGLSMLTRRHCDRLVTIPLRGATPSLNASVATALLLYEVARRSWMQGLRGGDPAPRLVRPRIPSTPLPEAVQQEVTAPGSPPAPQCHPNPRPDASCDSGNDAATASLAEALLMPQAAVPAANFDPDPDPGPTGDASPDQGVEAVAGPAVELHPDDMGATAPPASDAAPDAAPEPAGLAPVAELELGVVPAPSPSFAGDVDLGSLSL
ncbi:MAG: 23S rRNA (guanosine(2251)-2'-O)-methyltransferase RlmB [Cyanobacteria bacterium J06638_7]